MTKTKIDGLTELEREITKISLVETRRAIRQGLNAAKRVAVQAARGRSPSSRVKRAIKGGSTSMFRSRRGGVQFVGGGSNLGWTAVGVPFPGRVAPSSNRRAWFVAYSLEKGNPSRDSPRSQNRGRYRRRQVSSPFMADAIEGASSGIISAFETKVKSALKL